MALGPGHDVDSASFIGTVKKSPGTETGAELGGGDALSRQIASERRGVRDRERMRGKWLSAPHPVVAVASRR
jgi:hypothetical protein